MKKNIGIDFGTTNSVVSYYNQKEKLKTLKVDGEETIPTMVYFEKRDEYLFGKKARNRGSLNPSARIFDFKKDMGDSKKRYDITAKDGEKFQISPIDVAKLFLGHLIEKATKSLQKYFGPDCNIENLSITVPAKFTTEQIKNIKKAAKVIINGDVMVNIEPYAAAVAYQTEFGINVNDYILIYDFGGGTFDISIIQQKSNKYEIIGSDGDAKLGGNDITRKLMLWVCEEIKEEYGLDIPLDSEDFDEEDISEDDINYQSKKVYKENYSEIFDKMEKLKKNYSKNEEYSDILFLKRGIEEKEITFNLKGDKEQFDSTIQELIDRTMNKTKQIFDNLPIKIEDITKVVLAGGSSNLPIIKHELGMLFGDEKIYSDGNVNTLISRGAAIFSEDSTLIETTSKVELDYGVQTKKNMIRNYFNVLIPAGVQFPYKNDEDFQILNDDQERLEIKFFTRDKQSYPNSSKTSDDGIEYLETLTISNLPEGLKRGDRINIEFDLELDSLKFSVRVFNNKGNEVSNKDITIDFNS